MQKDQLWKGGCLIRLMRQDAACERPRTGPGIPSRRSGRRPVSGMTNTETCYSPKQRIQRGARRNISKPPHERTGGEQPVRQPEETHEDFDHADIHAGGEERKHL